MSESPWQKWARRHAESQPASSMHVHPGSWTAFLLHLEGLDYRRAMLVGAFGVATHVVGARHVWRVRIGETESAGCRVTVPEDST